MSEEPKILAVRSHSGRGDLGYVNAVDGWRIQRPFEKLQKETNWKVDIVTDMTFGKEDKLSQMWYVAGNYNLIYTTYSLTDPWSYAWLGVMLQKYPEMRAVIDIDDDIFNVQPWNPAYKVLGPGTRARHNIGIALLDAQNLVVTGEYLRKEYTKKRKKAFDKDPSTVHVIPNYASTEFYDHEPYENERVVIGWQGSAHHEGDLVESGFLRALERVLHRNKNVEFHYAAAAFPKKNVSFPAKRVRHISGDGDMFGWRNVYRRLQFDINCCPLEDVPFNLAKSNIKWQEGSLMGAATIASNVGPYKDSIRHMETGLLAKDEAEWEQYLELLIKDATLRKSLARNAKVEVEQKWSLEKNWKRYKEVIEKVMA